MYRKLLNSGIIAFTLVIFVTSDAHAYLDLGTGSFILQMLFGAALGAIVTVKIYWQKIKERLKSVVSRKTRKNSAEGE